MQDTFIEAALKQNTIDLENVQKGIHGFEGGGYDFRDTYCTPCYNLNGPGLKLLFEDLGTKSKAIHNELIIKKPTIRIDDENTSNWSATRDSLTEMNMFAVRLVDAIAKKAGQKGDLIRAVRPTPPPCLTASMTEARRRYRRGAPMGG
ncbi:hypothetical protein V490_02921 [Pseudogymnoascus sp. VKM F-3557]|nr:hypothetical protein V490_02921 [Pseudogymnoascus sp. VKM F-3557]